MKQPKFRINECVRLSFSRDHPCYKHDDKKAHIIEISYYWDGDVAKDLYVVRFYDKIYVRLRVTEEELEKVENDKRQLGAN